MGICLRWDFHVKCMNWKVTWLNQVGHFYTQKITSEETMCPDGKKNAATYFTFTGAVYSYYYHILMQYKFLYL